MMIKRYILLFLLPITFFSCVSTSKYNELETSKNKLRSELVRIQDENTDLKKVQSQYASLVDEKGVQDKEYNALKEEHSNLENAYNKLDKEFKDMLQSNKDMLNSSAEEKTKLAMQLAEKETRLEAQEKKLKEQEETLKKLEKDLYAREMKIRELETKISQQNEMISKVYDQISSVLMGYSTDDLTVTQKGGKIYISMSQNLLFATGSDKIDKKGIEAIKKVAKVLKEEGTYFIEVEGHTDSDGSAARNWELSTARATSVVNLLQNEGVNPERLIASGRAFYAPVAPNDSAENKAKNRRTEIVLSPDLSSLYSILETK